MTIYFIRVGHSGPIKIGYTRHFAFNRIGTLQGASPWPLTIIGHVEGSPAQEKHLHSTLAEHRMRGEWFAPNDRVIEVVARVLADEYPWVSLDLQGNDVARGSTRSRTSWDPGLAMAIKAVRGGVSALARGLGVSRQNIYGWRRIPVDHVVAIEEITGIAREHLRPDVFEGYRRKPQNEGAA